MHKMQLITLENKSTAFLFSLPVSVMLIPSISKLTLHERYFLLHSLL